MPPFAADGATGRVVRRIATSRGFRAVAPRVVPAADRALDRFTGGRVTLSGLLVPTLVVTTTGRRSGRPRPAPLACIPGEDGGWYVVGSNFGREHHPGWTANLLADPRAAVSAGRRRTPVRAELLDAEAKARVWPRLTAVWPAYDDYVASSGRDIRVFHLVPVDGPGEQADQPAR